MNINPTSHSHIESHAITNCMHEHHSVHKGGVSFQTEMQQSVKVQPQTVEEAPHELVAINREMNSKHNIFGIGNTLGDIVSDVNGEGNESVVVLLPDSGAEASVSNNGQLQVTPDMLNALIAPRNSRFGATPEQNRTKLTASSVMTETKADTNGEGQLHKKKKGLPSVASGIKKKIRKWLQELPKRILEKDNKQEIRKKEMKSISSEYLLNSYDKSGQYHQIENTGILNDSMNKRV